MNQFFSKYDSKVVFGKMPKEKGYSLSCLVSVILSCGKACRKLERPVVLALAPAEAAKAADLSIRHTCLHHSKGLFVMHPYDNSTPDSLGVFQCEM